MKKKKRILSFGLAVCCFVGLLGINTQKVKAAEYWPQDPETESPNAIVMEESTGTVLYDKNSTESGKYHEDYDHASGTGKLFAG